MLQDVQMIVHTAVPLDVTDILARRPKEPSRKAKMPFKACRVEEGTGCTDPTSHRRCQPGRG